MAVDRARVKELFFDATDLPEDEREAFVEAATRGDPELRAEVWALLSHHDDAPLIVERPAPPPAVDPLGLAGARLEGRLVVDRFVAEGGFAFVYQAHDEATGTPFAVKIWKTIETDERERLEAAFRREGEILDALAARVPTLVRTAGVGRCVGPRGTTLLYLVLEWLDGDVLRVPRGGLAPAEVIRTLTPVALALAEAHARGIAHRDVKPSNIFVTRDGVTRLLDFGIAKVAHDRERGFASTATASAGFTVSYAAPEQLLSHATGPWTDVYALAVVCLELLAGRHPYQGLSAIEVLLALPDPAHRPGPRAMGLEVSDALERALSSALVVPTALRPDMRSFWSAMRTAVEPE